ncbi:beta-lactamase/transpeptidase-like protein [Xylaria nigripes]|nr:beta-lactamase/transpeptidase-like protein [Xylaria nigripes]
MEQSLDAILKTHAVSSDETEVQDKLLAAGFLVVNKDGCIYEGTAGRLDFDPASPPYKPNSVSWFASMTKLAMAVSMLQLVERGLIKLEDDLSEMLPELAALPVLRGFDDDGVPILEPHGRAITLRHLLTHTLGISLDELEPDLQRWSQYVGRSARFLDFTLDGIKTPLNYAPGASWKYGTGLEWAGYLLTKLTNKTLSTYMRENIFEPLGMSSTTFDPKTRTLAFAYSHTDSAGHTILKPGPSPVPDTPAFETGGAGLFSTLADYGRLVHGVLTQKVLGPEGTALLFAPQLDEAQREVLMETVDAMREGGFAPELPRGCPVDYGLGGLVNMADVPEKRRAGSLMWSGMSNGRWWIDREAGLAGVVLTQVLPFGSRVLIDMYDELERVVYKHRD